MEDFFGADAALTSHAPDKRDWVATLMITGADLTDAWRRRESVIAEIRSRFDISSYRDDHPPELFGQA